MKCHDISGDLRRVLDKVLCDLRARHFTQPYAFARLAADNVEYYKIWWGAEEWCLFISAEAIKKHLMSKGSPWATMPLLLEQQQLTRELNHSGVVAVKSRRVRVQGKLVRRFGISVYELRDRGFKVDGLLYEQ